jgi:hypothetical protein
MVGIVKALHAEDSAENNTKAFSVLTAFSGGVWRKFFFFFAKSPIFYKNALIMPHRSFVRLAMVLPRET